MLLGVASLLLVNVTLRPGHPGLRPVTTKAIMKTFNKARTPLPRESFRVGLFRKQNYINEPSSWPTPPTRSRANPFAWDYLENKIT
jgi:hypothetical protein